MPITFEQPMFQGAFDISQGYGALQQQMQNRDYALRADTAQAQQDNNAANRYQQGQQFDSTQQAQQDAQQAQFAQQQALQQQAQQNAVDLNQAKLTQLDHMRAAQQANQIAILQQDPVLNQPEHAQELSGYINELQTGINTYQRRVQTEAAQQQQQEHQQRTQLVMEQLAAEHTRNQYMAQNAQDSVTELKDPRTGESLGLFQRNTHTGEWLPVAGPDGTPLAGGRARGAGAAHDGSLNEDQYLRHFQEVEKAVDAIARPQNGVAPTNPFGDMTEPNPDGGTRTRPMTRAEAVQERLQARGLAPSLDAFREERSRPTPTPIPEGTPPGRLNQVQSTTLQGLQAIQQQVPPGSDDALRLQSNIQIYRQYGSVRAMPPQQRTSFENTLRLLAQKYGGSNSNAGDATAAPGGAGGDW